MKPRIDRTAFGSITIEGALFEHDVISRLNGRPEKRKKKLSKAIYGTSHIISLAEAEHVFEIGAERLIVGAGQKRKVASLFPASWLLNPCCMCKISSTFRPCSTWKHDA